MSESASPTVSSENLASLAEEHYQRGNLNGAIDIVNTLTFGYANTSTNHLKFSQVLVAYQIHWRLHRENSTHYSVLRISSPFCSHQTIEREYMDLVSKLCPNTNKSVAAKSALEIIDTARAVLSDPKSRREYDMEQGFVRWGRFRYDAPYRSVKQGKRHCIGSIEDSGSDSNSD